MNNDELYGLSQFSPLRSIYNRGSRSIYAPRLEKTSNVATVSAPPVHAAHVAHVAHVGQPSVPPGNTSSAEEILERHLKALQSIDKRLSALDRRDDQLQTKVQTQEVQLERLQNSMKLLFEQSKLAQQTASRNAEVMLMHQTATQTESPSVARTRNHSATGRSDKLAAGSQNLQQRHTDNSEDYWTSNKTLIVVGLAILTLLLLIFALMVAKWHAQQKEKSRAQKTEQIENSVKRAMFDVLSQSQSQIGNNSDNPFAKRLSLANSMSLPVAYGP